MSWIGRSAVARWRCIANTLYIQEDVKEAGLELSVVQVGQAYCILSFSFSVIKDCALENSGRWFSKWFLGVEA